MTIEEDETASSTMASIPDICIVCVYVRLCVCVCMYMRATVAEYIREMIFSSTRASDDGRDV